MVHEKSQQLFRWLFSWFCGETGIRTPATVARRQFSKLLHYHSGTSPDTAMIISKAVTKLTKTLAETTKTPILDDQPKLIVQPTKR